MAIAKAPLLSLSARGKFAKTLTASQWKGKKILKSFSTPSNPDTTAQRIHRTIFAAAIYFWRNNVVFQDVKASWNKLASARGLPASGYNLTVSSLIASLKSNPLAVIALDMNDAGEGDLSADLLVISTGERGTEAGMFQFWKGSNSRNLVIVGERAAGDDYVSMHGFADPGETAYCSLSKNGVQLYGIKKITFATD